MPAPQNRSNSAEISVRQRLLRHAFVSSGNLPLRNPSELMAALGRTLVRDLGSNRFNELVSVVSIAQYDSDTVTFLCPCEVCHERFESAYRKRVETLLRELTNRKLTFRCLVSEGLSLARGGKHGRNRLCRLHAHSSGNSDSHRATGTRTKTDGWTEMKFENFRITPGNELAYKVCLSLVDGKFGSPLPRLLLIWGPAGSGKTHLLNAVWRHASSLKPPANVVAATMPDFVRQYTLSIKTSRQESFRQKFRTAGLLLLDDIHLIPDTDAIQEELTNTIDALLEGRKKMLFTSRLHPSKIRHLRNRLRSRLCACVDVRIATYEGFSSPLLSDNHAARLRTAQAHAAGMRRQQITAQGKPLAPQPGAVSGSVRSGPPQTPDSTRGISPEDIERLVGSRFGVRVADMRSSSRRTDVTTARHLCYWLARNLMGLTWREIASSFGERNYSNVVTACKKLGARLREDTALQQTEQSLREKLLDLETVG